MVHGEEALLEDVAKLESKLKAIRRKGNLVLESQICNVLGKKYEALGEWKEALTFHYFDAEIGAAMDDYEGQMIALHNMSMVYRRLKMYMKARGAFKRMVSVAEKVPSLAEKRVLVQIVGSIPSHFDLEWIGGCEHWAGDAVPGSAVSEELSHCQ